MSLISGARTRLKKQQRIGRLARYESLEDRSMLAVGAVGVFERVGGFVEAEAVAAAGVPGDGFTDGPKIDQGEDLVHLSAAAQAADEDGNFAFANSETTAFIPTPIGGDIAAPFVTSASISNVHAHHIAVATTYQSSGSEAQGEFEYHAPDGAGDLVFHIHLYIAAYGGSVSTQNAQVLPATTALASADQYGISLSGPDNLHDHFTVPIQDGSITTLSALTNSRIDARSHGEGEFATGIWSGVATAWGYVTAEGQDVTPGDFNYDGFVDELDYDIWDQGLPQADANFDGIVDEHDYCIWAENVDGILVSTAVDESDGDYSYGDLSLREALLLAADANHPGPDIIAFDCSLLGGAITLNPSLGALNVNSDVSILGPGADLLTIDAQSNSRVFYVDSGVEATLSGMTITGGGMTATGAGIYSAGTLTIQQSQIVGNNTNANGRGGGIYQAAVTGTSLTIIDSTIANNTAHIGGGVNTSVATTIINSTISSNTAPRGGGGIYASGSDIKTVINSTITANTSSGTTAGSFHSAGNSTLALHNTIVAGNNGQAGVRDISGGAFISSSSNNLIGDDSNLTNGINNGVNGNKVGGEGTDPAIDPRLDVLDDYGGRTKTHALLSDSPAINSGDDTITDGFELEFDQRGPGFDRKIGTIDIGAFEYDSGSGLGTGALASSTPTDDEAPAIILNESHQFVIDSRSLERQLTSQLTPNHHPISPQG